MLQLTVPAFDFYLKVDLPKKRKDRKILLRDYLGRIIKAKVPDLIVPCA